MKWRIGSVPYLNVRPLIYGIEDQVTQCEPSRLADLGLDRSVPELHEREDCFWDGLQEQAGKANARLNSGEARKRADNLQGRLQKRLEDLKLEAQISPLPPVVLGGLLVPCNNHVAAWTSNQVADDRSLDVGSLRHACLRSFVRTY